MGASGNPAHWAATAGRRICFVSVRLPLWLVSRAGPGPRELVLLCVLGRPLGEEETQEGLGAAFSAAQRPPSRLGLRLLPGLMGVC